MTERIKGIAEIFREFSEAVQRAILGYEIRENPVCEPGEGYWIEDGRTFVVHPFDAIGMRHGKDYAARLDAVAEYIGQEAGRKAERIIERLDRDTLRDRIAQHAAVPVEYLKPVIMQKPDGTWPERPKSGPVMYIGSDRYPAPPGELIDDEWLIRPVAHRAVSRRERWRAAVAAWLEEHLP